MSHASLERSLGTPLPRLPLWSGAWPPRPQPPVAMEPGCHPTPPSLGRRLVARHHLLRHLSFQRACFRLSEGGQVPGGPAALRGRGSKQPEAGVCGALASTFRVSACSWQDSVGGWAGLVSPSYRWGQLRPREPRQGVRWGTWELVSGLRVLCTALVAGNGAALPRQRRGLGVFPCLSEPCWPCLEQSPVSPACVI